MLEAWTAKIRYKSGCFFILVSRNVFTSIFVVDDYASLKLLPPEKIGSSAILVQIPNPDTTTNPVQELLRLIKYLKIE